MQSSYIKSAQQAEQLPQFPWPEIAFVGRSNCGKSSLLNALLGRRNLARTSNTPGRTQMVNFFGVEQGEKQVILADLPGYGYSAISREVRRHWQSLMDAYLRRPGIVSLLFLIDCRRASGLDAEDLALLQHLSQARSSAPITIVLTKSDKLNRSQLQSAVAALANAVATLGINPAKILSVSSLKKAGIDLLRADIERLLQS